MWQRGDTLSSSDESLEEERSPDISGGFETVATSCKLKPVFDNIFADIKASIPTFDFEDSSEDGSDNEEPLVFARKVWPLSPRILSQRIVSGIEVVGSPTSGASDSGFSFVSPDGQSATASSLPDSEQGSIDLRSGSSPLSSFTLQPESVTSSFGKTHTIGANLPTSLTTTPNGSTYKAFTDNVDAKETVKLNLDLIEHLDLSNLLERTNEVTVPPVFPPTLSDAESSEAEDDSSSLMEELVRLSRKQQNAAAPGPGSLISHHLPDISRSIRNKAHDVGVTCGQSVATTDLKDCLSPLSASKSADTVFLDLRELHRRTSQSHQELPESICRILGITNKLEDSSSSSDEEDDLQQWQIQRQKAKQASLFSARQKITIDHHHPRKATAKHTNSVDKTKSVPKEAVRKSKDREVLPGFSTEKVQQARDTDMVSSDSTKKNVGILNLKKNHEIYKAEGIDETKKAWAGEPLTRKKESIIQNDFIIIDKEADKDFLSTQERSLPSHSSPVMSEMKTISNEISPSKREDLKSADYDDRNGLISPKNDKIKRSTAKLKQAFSEEEKAKRQRLQRILQNLKPQFSSHGHHPVARVTPILFHEEASYESDIISLPDLDTTVPHLLMSAKLSRCGELATIRQGPRGEPTPETHCFSHLIAWLCCLSHPSVNAPTDFSEICRTPFYVVGLQQTWHEGQLQLDIGICSRTGQGEHQKKTKAHAFRQAVNKFLSTNSLHSVYLRLLEFEAFPLNSLSDKLINKKSLSSLLTLSPDSETMHRVFSATPGFFWQTMELEHSPSEEKHGVRFSQEPEIQNTLTMLQCPAYHEPSCFLDVLARAQSKALDVAGIRMVYRQKDTMLQEKPAYGFQLPNMFVQEGMATDLQIPTLVLALRGPRAISGWQDEVGPLDTQLARRTDPKSLRALYSGGAKEDHLFWCPRNAQSAATELARWFGGRVPESGIVNVGSNAGPVSIIHEESTGSSSDKESAGSQLLTTSLHTTSRPPPHFLTATTDTDVFFIVSPSFPVQYLGLIFCFCFEKGFSVQGIKRLRLSPNHLRGLGLPPEVLSRFGPGRVNQSKSFSKTTSPVPSTVLFLRRENAIHHMLSVVKSLTNFTGVSQSNFLSVSYSDSLLKQFGGNFAQTPDPAAYPVDLLRHAFHSNPELEQVCVLMLLKDKATIFAGAILKELLQGNETPDLTVDGSFAPYCCFELLGLKLLPSLSLHQAKEFTPCKIGDVSWKRSLQTLAAGPALVLALRGVGAFAQLRRFVESHSDSSKSKFPKDSILSDMVLSCTPELACRQLSVIFFDRELFSDQSARRNLHLLPPPRRVINCGSCSGSSETLNEAEPSGKQRNRRVGLGKPPTKASLGSVETLQHGEMSVLQSLLEKPRVIPTVCVLKPSITTKHLGKVLKRLGQEGFSVIGLKVVSLSYDDVKILMANKEKDIDLHVSHMTSGPVVSLCLQRENAVGRLLEVLGPCDARVAKRQSQFLLRGSFGEDSIRNAFYGSETYCEAIRDMKLLFVEGVCCPPTIDLKAEEIPCLALDDIFSVTTNRTLVELTTEEQTKVYSSPGMIVLPSSLLEINCLLLLPQMLVKGAQQRKRISISYAEIIEALLTAGFHFIGLRMLLLGVAQAADCAKLYSGCLPADWKRHHLAVQLSKTPFIVMAVLRDGAVTCYDTLCDSSPKLKALTASSGRFMLAGKTLKEAKRMVECFFDRLIPNRKARLEPSAG